MLRLIKIIAAALVLLCVLAVVVAPSLDLPDTSIRGLLICVAILQSLGLLVLLARVRAFYHLSLEWQTLPLLVSESAKNRTQLIC